jgi:hypothetical protein
LVIAASQVLHHLLKRTPVHRPIEKSLGRVEWISVLIMNIRICDDNPGGAGVFVFVIKDRVAVRKSKRVGPINRVPAAISVQIAVTGGESRRIFAQKPT